MSLQMATSSLSWDHRAGPLRKGPPTVRPEAEIAGVAGEGLTDEAR